jgi:YD repeat-containing protein
LYTPYGLALGPDGSIYIVEINFPSVRRVGPDGIITTVASVVGAFGFEGDGGPATAARFNRPRSIAVGPDSSLYIADTGNNRIRWVGPNGIIKTVAGNGSPGFSGDGGLATQAQLNSPFGVALGPDGSLYVADTANQRIRRVAPDGIITTVAGTGIQGFSGDGGPAAQAQLNVPTSVAVQRDGTLYVVDAGNQRIRSVAPTGIITTAGGNGTRGFGGDNGLATQAQLSLTNPGVGFGGVAVGPDGSLYVADSDNRRVRKMNFVRPRFVSTDIHVLSEDGSELYIFESTGRHRQTLDAVTLVVRYQFTYDSAGRLIQVADVDRNVTTIERDSGGNVTAIVSPFGQRTTLLVDSNGFLARITNPAGEAVQLVSTAGGLLTSLTDPRSNTHRFFYDLLGRLVRDEDPAGGFSTLSSTGQRHTLYRHANDSAQPLKHLRGRAPLDGWSASDDHQS